MIKKNKKKKKELRARGKCNTFFVCFRYVIRRRRGKTAFGFLHSLSLSHHALSRSRFPVAPGRWCRSRRFRRVATPNSVSLSHSRTRVSSVFLARARARTFRTPKTFPFCLPSFCLALSLRSFKFIFIFYFYKNLHK